MVCFDPTKPATAQKVCYMISLNMQQYVSNRHRLEEQEWISEQHANRRIDLSVVVLSDPLLDAAATGRAQ